MRTKYDYADEDAYEGGAIDDPRLPGSSTL
jgi:hypothetical protein